MRIDVSICDQGYVRFQARPHLLQGVHVLKWGLRSGAGITSPGGQTHQVGIDAPDGDGGQEPGTQAKLIIGSQSPQADLSTGGPLLPPPPVLDSWGDVLDAVDLIELLVGFVCDVMTE